MGACKDSQVSSDRRRWQKIFDNLVRMLKTQQNQLESLMNERKLLKDRIQIQHDRWIFDVHLLEDRISMMNDRISQEEMGRLLEAAKSDLVVGLKKTEAFLFKLKFERSDDDLDDLKLWLDHLTCKCTDQKNSSREKMKEIDKGKGEGENNNLKSLPKNKDEQHHIKILEGEVRKLKRSYESLTSTKNAEVSAILSERNFVWNQFKKMESDYTILLKSKRAEVEQANEKIEKLIANMGQLQSSNGEKDEIISNLKNNLTKVEADAFKSNTEIERLSRELDLLRNSRSVSVTPVLNRCTSEERTCSLESKKNDRNGRRPLKTRESDGSIVSGTVKNTDKGSGTSSKRRRYEPLPNSETPRLFSSSFTVPKLKNPSPLSRLS